MKLRWIPPLLLAAFVVVGFSIRQAQLVHADATLTASPAIAIFGQPITVTGTVTGAASVSVTLASGTWATASVSSGAVVSGIGTRTITYTAIGPATVSAVTSCDSPGGVLATLQAVPVPASSMFTAQATATCNANGQPQLGCVPYTLNYSPNSSTNAPCQSACPSVNANMLGPSISPCSFPYPASSGGLASCPAPYSNPITNNYFYGQNPPNPFPSYAYPTTSGLCSTPVAVNAAPSAPTQVTLSSDTSNLTCGGSTLVTMQVKDANGNNVSDGTTVAVKASIGTLSVEQATTSSGYAWAVFTAPSSGSGSSTITASVGSLSSTTTVNVNCGLAANVPQSVGTPTSTSSSNLGSGSSPVPARPATSSGIPTFSPPNTGDAGLAASRGTVGQ